MGIFSPLARTLAYLLYFSQSLTCNTSTDNKGPLDRRPTCHSAGTIASLRRRNVSCENKDNAERVFRRESRNEARLDVFHKA
jgi:hypothetical protein